ncbi:MAG: Dioxygenases related to 2-nitropropane dioxygenase, partial [uncultured Acetobacteraceae bacterium]
VPGRQPRGSALPPRHRGASLHHLGARPRRGAMHGGRRGLHAVAECPPDRAVRGMGGRDTGTLGGARRAPPRAPGRALRHQPHRPPLERPAGAGSGDLREAPRAHHHHQPGRAAGGEPSRPLLRRIRAARRDQPDFRAQSGREGCGRAGARRGGGGRARRLALALRAGAGNPCLVRRAARPVGRDLARRLHPGRRGHGGGFRLRRQRVRRHRGGAGRGRLQAHGRRALRGRHRLHQRHHRRARQLLEAVPARRRTRPGQPADVRPHADELRDRPQQAALEGHLGLGPGHRRRRRGGARGRAGGAAAARVPRGARADRLGVGDAEPRLDGGAGRRRRI